MASPLSNLVNNLSERIYKIKCKHGHEEKKSEVCVIKYEYFDCFLESTNFKDDLIEHKYLCCNKNYPHKFDEKLKERFFNTYKYSNHNNNNFVLLLWKGAYTYEYIDYWEKFNETSLLEKHDFYSHLNIEDITDADYAHAKRSYKDVKIKKLGEYHDFVCSKRYIIVS